MSTGTIFDFYDEDLSNQGASYGENELSFESQRQKSLPQQNGTPEQDLYQQSPSDAGERIRSIVGAYPKGVFKEFRTEIDKIKTFPLPSFLKKLAPTEEEIEEEYGKFEEELNKLLPTQNKFTERSLERGGRIFPYAALGGNVIGGGIRSAVAGFLGEGGKEVGLPEDTQMGLEFIAFAAPDIITKKLLETGKYGALIKKAREMGLSDEAIAPLIQGDWKKKIFSKLASRRGKTQRLLKPQGQVQTELGNVYDTLKSSKAAQKVLGEEAQKKVINDLQKVYLDLPKKQRDLIQEDLQRLSSNPITGESLMDFYKKVGANLEEKTAQLSRLKNPIKTALADISPSLANDFNFTNQLYSQYKNISSMLKPTLVSDILSASQALKLMGGIAFGYYPILVETMGEQAAKILSREMLVNPRFQQIGQKIASALKNNKTAALRPLVENLIKEVKKVSPEASKELQSIDYEELIHLLQKESE